MTSPTCKRPGHAGRPAVAKDLCDTCYRAHRRSGLVTAGYVDAVPVRKHLGKLTSLDWSAAAIGRAAGVARRNIDMLLGGSRKKVNASTAKKILAVPLAAPAPAGHAAFRIDLPWQRPLLNSNSMPSNPRARGRIVQQVQHDVMYLAKHHKLPKGKHLTIQLHYAPGTWQRMDGHNLHPTVKAVVDALARPARKVDPRNPRSRPWTGLSLVPDDTDQYVTILEPAIVRPPEPGPRCWLTIKIER